MTGNLGATSLRRRRRSNSMRDFDNLPPALRHWLSRAAMPWSPTSCRRIWLTARSRGESIDMVLARLDRAERGTLSRDTHFAVSAPD